MGRLIFDSKGEVDLYVLHDARIIISIAKGRLIFDLIPLINYKTERLLVLWDTRNPNSALQIDNPRTPLTVAQS
jgi:hypothetical protein